MFSSRSWPDQATHNRVGWEQGRIQGGATDANAPVRFSGASEDLLLAHVESPQ